MIVWKQIPAKEAEVRTRIILEIVAGALRRKRDEQQHKVEAGQSAAATKSTEGTAMMIS